MSYTYDRRFMEYTDVSSRYSAKRTVAVLRALPSISSVLDVGCARGTWLRAWQAAGISDSFGVDGAYAKSDGSEVHGEHFLATDLSRPFDLQRRFDVVQSLEVAEHIPAASADIFVENLVRHSSGTILFSAAPPGQGGEYHVNEQPYEYWRRKFHRHGYSPYDFVRPLLRGDRGVSSWYRFNTLLYLADEQARRVSDVIHATRVADHERITDVAPLWFKFRKSIILLLPFSVQQSLARLKARAKGSHRSSAS